jgi:hypothetical protein
MAEISGDDREPLTRRVRCRPVRHWLGFYWNAVELLGVSPKSAKRIGGMFAATHRLARRLG